jgi:hypothetical protein
VIGNYFNIEAWWWCVIQSTGVGRVFASLSALIYTSSPHCLIVFRVYFCALNPYGQMHYLFLECWLSNQNIAPVDRFLPEKYIMGRLRLRDDNINSIRDAALEPILKMRLNGQEDTSLITLFNFYISPLPFFCSLL